MSLVITIDGPAASGKSSASRELARRLGFRWVSTGAFYRGLAFLARERQADLTDEARLVALANSDEWEVRLGSERTEVLVGGRDVTDQINAEEVGSIASRISNLPDVREALLGAQRDCATKGNGLVAEGRDCGTVVFPGADVKVYLTASSENRAARRAAEQGIDKDEVAEAQKQRDQQDSTRRTAPLMVPQNAFVLDTTALDLQGVVNSIESHVREVLGGRLGKA